MAIETQEPLQVTKKEAARLLGMSTRTLEREVGRGRIKTVPFGTGYQRRVRMEDIRTYLEARGVEAGKGL